VQGRGALRDKTFVLTGTLDSMTREEAERKIMARRARDVVGQRKTTSWSPVRRRAPS